MNFTSNIAYEAFSHDKNFYDDSNKKKNESKSPRVKPLPIDLIERDKTFYEEITNDASYDYNCSVFADLDP